MQQEAARNALKRAIEIAKSQTALAAAIGPGIRTGHIFYWLSRGAIPARHCPAIERATGGAVTRKDLRPDDWQDIWPELVEA